MNSYIAHAGHEHNEEEEIMTSDQDPEITSDTEEPDPILQSGIAPEPRQNTEQADVKGDFNYAPFIYGGVGALVLAALIIAILIASRPTGSKKTK